MSSRRIETTLRQRSRFVEPSNVLHFRARAERGSVYEWVAEARVAFRRWRRRGQDRVWLANCSERELRDIGVPGWVAREEGARSIWRAPLEAWQELIDSRRRVIRIPEAESPTRATASPLSVLSGSLFLVCFTGAVAAVMALVSGAPWSSLFGW